MTRIRPNRLALALLGPAVLCIVPALQAQSPGRVAGRVASAITGEPIPDVLITIVGSPRTARTDEDGAYLLDSVIPGLVKVAAQVIGYVPITTPYYTVRPDAETTVNFRLAPVTVELEPVEITGERPIQRAAVGSFLLTAQQLPKQGDILQALQGAVPGLRVQGRNDQARTVIRRSLADVLYVVDGVVITPPLTFYLDAAMVDCVEVRRGMRAAQEFRKSIHGELYGGVVLIWTRGSTAPRPRACYEQGG